MIEASWRGFDHDTEPDGGLERGYHLIAAPHAAPKLDVIIKNAEVLIVIKIKRQVFK